jgi:hypothetical protein
VNGKTAKRLRKIARELKLNPQTGYVPGGPLRRRPDRWEFDELGVEKRRVQGAPIQRPGVLTACFRRALKEAKKVYKGQPPSICVPEADDAKTPFHVSVVDSMRKQVDAGN